MQTGKSSCSPYSTQTLPLSRGLSAVQRVDRKKLMLELRPQLVPGRGFDSLSSMYEDEDSISFCGTRGR